MIRRAYHRKVLATHPDKGGDAREFRDVQSAFEVLREFYDRGRVITFRSEENNQTSTSEAFQNAADYFAAKEARGDTQSRDYYAEAAEEDVPTYRVEPAKSDRSTCTAKHKGGVRRAEDPERCFTRRPDQFGGRFLHALGPPRLLAHPGEDLGRFTRSVAREGVRGRRSRRNE